MGIESSKTSTTKWRRYVVEQLAGVGATYNIVDNSDATFLTVDSNENSTFSGQVNISSASPEINLLESDVVDKNVEIQLSGGALSFNRRTDADGYVNTFVNYNSNGQLTFSADHSIPSKIDLRAHRIDLNTRDSTLGITGGDEMVNLQTDVTITGEVVLKKVTETKSTLSGTTPTVDLDNGTVFTHTVATGTTTYTFSNPGAVASFTLIITNGGSQTVNWPASVDWAGGTAPTLTTSGVDVLTFVTPDSGTTWYGFVGGLDMK